jgi:ABC-2 type transport system permease protein
VALLTVALLFATAFLGSALRACFRRRETSMQAIRFTSLPMVFLGGFAWPVEALREWVHAAATFMPSTTAIPGYLRLTRLGAGQSDVARETALLWSRVAVYFPAACLAESLQARSAASR